MGADSAAANSWESRPTKTSKLIRLSTSDGNPILLGYTTSFRFGQILAHHVDAPADSRTDAEAYLIKDFLPVVRRALSEHGFMEKIREREEGGTALIAYRSRLFRLSGDLGIVESSEKYDAVGAGMYYALGAMHAANERQTRGALVVQFGLKAAIDLCPGVEGPLHSEVL